VAVYFGGTDLSAQVGHVDALRQEPTDAGGTGANRFYVHEQVADEFSRRLAHRMGALSLGEGWKEGVEVGPLIDGQSRDKSTGWFATRSHAARPS
jgi:succinate-semialdehyde dehydrogenase/glutarate-semialdehyde dehydrogenase